jgi:hypothetical protein
MRHTLLLLFLLLAISAFAEDFPTACHPYGVEKQPIDAKCGLTGDPTTTDPNHLQNQAKNDLCASGIPKPLKLKTLKSLQQAVDATGLVYGSAHNNKPGPPATRAAITAPINVDGQTYREGELVYFVGYIADAHPTSAETVNCGLTKKINLDTHFALSEKKLKYKKTEAKTKRDAKLCKSFGAEIIPHLRPDMWDAAYVKDLEKEQAIVKVTGHLFFDASHQPCNGKAPLGNDPARFTVWEIHPIYDLQVCKNTSMSACSAANASLWQTVEEWEGPPDRDED